MDSQQQPALLDVSKLKYALRLSWEYVAQDLDEEDYNSCTNRDAIEIAIDADRLLMLGNDKEAHAYLRECIVNHGYEAVLDFLSENVRVL